VNYDNTKSFFCNTRKILEIYELPKIHELQSNLPPKPKWKNLVNSNIKKYWKEKLRGNIWKNNPKIYELLSSGYRRQPPSLETSPKIETEGQNGNC
jgi:hypothetical protein